MRKRIDKGQISDKDSLSPENSRSCWCGRPSWQPGPPPSCRAMQCSAEHCSMSQCSAVRAVRAVRVVRAVRAVRAVRVLRAVPAVAPALQCSALNCTELHCTELHCTELHCTPTSLHYTCIHHNFHCTPLPLPLHHHFLSSAMHFNTTALN